MKRGRKRLLSPEKIQRMKDEPNTAKFWAQEFGVSPQTVANAFHGKNAYSTEEIQNEQA